MRKHLISAVAIVALASPALASDLPSSKSGIFTTNSFDWTGFYAGVDLGGQWGKVGSKGAVHADGIVGGGFVGYNKQFGTFVVGIEGDVSGSSYGRRIGNAEFTNPVGGSVRGRLGYALDTTLLYATGGLALGELKFTSPAPGFNSDVTRTGFTVGGGVERALSKNLIARVEYRYTRFDGVLVGAKRYAADDHRVTAGVAWKF
jgi:outer membrane immunogenic protein